MSKAVTPGGERATDRSSMVGAHEVGARGGTGAKEEEIGKKLKPSD